MVAYRARAGRSAQPQVLGGAIEVAIFNTAGASELIGTAQVVAHNLTTGQVFNGVWTAQAGLLLDVAPGVYTVTATATGFTPGTGAPIPNPVGVTGPFSVVEIGLTPSSGGGTGGGTPPKSSNWLLALLAAGGVGAYLLMAE